MNAYNKILAAIAYQAEAEYVSKKAGLMADAYGATLTLAHVIEKMQLVTGPDAFAYVELFAEEKEAKKRAEKDLVMLAENINRSDVAVRLPTGIVKNEILALLEKENIDLGIIGSHSHGRLSALLGSTANAVLHHAKTDIMAVKIPPALTSGREIAKGYNRILVAVDFTPDIEPVIKRARDLVRRFNAELILVHGVNRAPVFEMPLSLFEKEIIEKINWQFKQLVQLYELEDVRTEIRVGSPSHEITEFAAKEAVDLIVVGSHGRHGLGLLLGSTANAIFHKARCDTLAVRITP